MPTKYKRGSGQTHPVDLYVGYRLNRCRIEKGISQTRLADLIGLSFQQLQKYENGNNRISASKLFELARALHVKPGYFYDGYSPDDPLPSQPDLPPVPASWSDLYHGLKPRARRAIINLIHMLIPKENPEE